MKKYAVRFIAPSLAGVIVFYIWAFVLVIKKSFLVSGISGWAGFSNYKNVLMNRVFWMAMKNTVLYMLACISILLISTLFVAWVITEELPIHRVLKNGYLESLFGSKGAGGKRFFTYRKGNLGISDNSCIYKKCFVRHCTISITFGHEKYYFYRPKL